MTNVLQASAGPSLDPIDTSFWQTFHWDDPRYKDDPFPWLHKMREQSPVHLLPWGLYRLSRYEDVLTVLRHSEVGMRNSRGELPLLPETETERRVFMVHQDPPAHTRLRRMVSRAFTPRAVERMRPRVEALVDELLDRVADAGRMDVIADLALPVPSIVICEMLGVPVEDRERFTGWTADSTLGLLGTLATPEQAKRVQVAVQSLAEYFRELIASRSRALGDDMLSTLIRVAEDGDRLSPEELLAQSIGLLVAGFETTIGLIGNGVRELILHPGELARLEDDHDLIDSAVEECLRFAGPVPATQRVLRTEMTFCGVTLPADSPVLLSLIVANRDPEVFPDPDRFDIARTPNEHVAFGGGLHFCLGASLARMEARAAILGLVRRFRGLKLESAEIHWGPSLFRVLGELPIRFELRG